VNAKAESQLTQVRVCSLYMVSSAFPSVSKYTLIPRKESMPVFSRELRLPRLRRGLAPEAPQLVKKFADRGAFLTNADVADLSDVGNLL